MLARKPREDILSSEFLGGEPSSARGRLPLIVGVSLCFAPGYAGSLLAVLVHRSPASSRNIQMLPRDDGMLEGLREFTACTVLQLG